MIWLSFFICSVRRCFLACFTRLKTRIDFLIKLRHIRDVSDMNEILHISILPMHPAGDFGWYVLMLGQNRATHSYEIISSKLGKGMFSMIQNSLSLCLSNTSPFRLGMGSSMMLRESLRACPLEDVLDFSQLHWMHALRKKVSQHDHHTWPCQGLLLILKRKRRSSMRSWQMEDSP